MYSGELLKGTLSALVLKLLVENQKMYGYQITQKVKELSKNKILIKEGSLYPALHKLRKDGYVDVESIKIGKRIRHYYFLTPKGIDLQQKKEIEIKDFINTISMFFTS